MTKNEMLQLIEEKIRESQHNLNMLARSAKELQKRINDQIEDLSFHKRVKTVIENLEE
jgi:predicted transcriptional regulator